MKPPNSSKLLNKLSSTGTTVDLLQVTKQKEDIVDTNDPIYSLDFLILQQLNNSQQVNQNETSATVEYPHLDKEKTWKDKQNGLDPIILTTKLLETLDQASTLKEKDLTPYWTQQSKVISEKLWLPTEIDYVDSVLNSMNELSNNTPMGKSWFSIKNKHLQKKNSLMTSFQLSQYSLPDSMDYEVINSKTKSKNKLVNKTDSKKIKTLKVRLFPSDKEKDEIKLMMDQQRWYYNATLSIMNKNYTPEQLIKPDSWSYIHIRDLIRGYEYSETIKKENNKEIIERDFIKKDNNTDYPFPRNGKTNEEWWKDSVNGRVIRGASKKFTTSLNSGISNLKSKNISSFRMSYLSRKEPVSYLHFDDGNYPSFINKIRSTYWFRKRMNNKVNKTRSVISLKEIIEQTKKSSIEVIFDKVMDKYYVHIPVDINWYPSTDIRNENQMKYIVDDNIISLDPGVRKFLVGYDPKGNNIFFGEDAQIKIIQLLLEVDQCKDGSHLLKWRKISNLISELHWKCISYLIQNYKIILLPDFRVSQMLRGRKLGIMTKRLLSMFSFYKFKEKLIYKCEQYSKKLYIVNESFTSKCCGVCGNIDSMLGSKKVYSCKKCGVSMDRDSAGARNILLKHLIKKETI
jgi:IS605 OrfB family transposase